MDALNNIGEDLDFDYDWFVSSKDLPSSSCHPYNLSMNLKDHDRVSLRNRMLALRSISSSPLYKRSVEEVNNGEALRIEFNLSSKIAFSQPSKVMVDSLSLEAFCESEVYYILKY
jgi:hypothetical protein